MKKTKLKKMPFFIIILIFSVAFLCIFVLISNDKSKVCFENTCFKVEKANTPEERAEGLMFRESLGTNKGMLFVFEDENIYPFWMKNTNISLDMIWINSTSNVVFIYENAIPCNEVCPSIIPNKNASYVLEINSGLAEKYNIKVGDEVKIFDK